MICKILNGRMLVYASAVVFFFAACRSGDIACPEPKKVRAKRVTVPTQVRLAEVSIEPQSRSQHSREKSFQRMREEQMEARAAKTPQAAEEWDCPKPGAVKRYSKVVKENIKKNKKKMKSYLKNRAEADSVFTFLQPKNPN